MSETLSSSHHDPSLKEHKKKKRRRDETQVTLEESVDVTVEKKKKRKKHDKEVAAVESPAIEVTPETNELDAATEKKKKKKEKRKHERESIGGAEANSAEIPGKERKKKKRKHDVPTTEADGVEPQVEDAEVNSEEVAGKDKKKKKRKRDQDQSVVDADAVHQVEAGAEVTPEDTAGKERKKKKRKHDQPAPDADAMEVSGTATEQTPVVASDLPPKKKKEKGKAKAPGNHHEPAALQATSGGEASTAALPAPSFISPPAGSLFPLPSYIQAPYFPAAQPTVSLFPTPVPFTDIAFGSNEDVLRALQQLDLSNVAGVLNGVPSAPTVSDLLGDNAPSKHLKHRRTLDMSLAEPSSTQQTTPAHAHLIATKWMTPPKLAELVKSEGLYYKKGKFSAIEVKQVNDAIHNYLTTRGLSEEDLQNIIFPPDEKSKDGTFWTEITSAVPQRPLVAVYHYVRRSHHPMKQQGRWRPDEDTNLLQAVASLGQQWEKVAKRVGRMATDCRDRYRNHIVDRDVRVSGPWSKEEEAELTRIVTELTVKKGKDMDNDVFWTKVTKLMGGKRSRQQCRIKWTDSLSRQYKNEGRNLRWSRQDAFILIHKIDALNVRDDSEIDWKKLPDPQWNYWSAHILQRRWLTMKKGVKEYEDMTHPEIMDILRAKNAELPKFTSKETIDDEHDDDSEPEAEAAAEAGSSTGPGTASALAVQGGKDDDDSDDSDEDSDDSE